MKCRVEEEALVYKDGYVHRGDWSGWGFSVIIQGKVVSEQSSVYRCTTSTMMMKEVPVTATLRLLAGTSVGRVVMVIHCQSA